MDAVPSSDALNKLCGAPSSPGEEQAALEAAAAALSTEAGDAAMRAIVAALIDEIHADGEATARSVGALHAIRVAQQRLPPAAAARAPPPEFPSAHTLHGILRGTANSVAAVLQAARAGPPIPAYVINRKSREDRWKDVLAQFRGAPFLELIRVEATEGSDLERGVVARPALSLRATSTMSVKMACTDIDSWGAVGCTASHIRVWRAIVASGKPAFVFEDDACLLLQVLANLATALHVGGGTAGPLRGLDYIQLGSHGYARPSAVVRMALPLAAAEGGPELALRVLVPFPLGALSTGSHAYWTTPRAAAAFLAAAEPLEVSVDGYMHLVLERAADGAALFEGMRAYGTAPSAAAVAAAPPASTPEPAANGGGGGRAATPQPPQPPQPPQQPPPPASMLPPLQPSPHLWAAWLQATTTLSSGSDIAHPPSAAETALLEERVGGGSGGGDAAAVAPGQFTIHLGVKPVDAAMRAVLTRGVAQWMESQQQERRARIQSSGIPPHMGLQLALVSRLVPPPCGGLVASELPPAPRVVRITTA